jgi:hypothetical protein
MERKSITMLMTIALLAFTALALMLVSVPAVSAKTLECNLTIIYNVYPDAGPNHPGVYLYWKGEITGGITGTVYFWETAKNFIVGKNEHYFEDFYIDLGTGWISGYDNGVWNFATFKFRAHGRVTAASENYAYLIGNFFFEEGTTTDPFTMGLPVTGIGAGFIGP